jgi:large repetitive protein
VKRLLTIVAIAALAGAVLAQETGGITGLVSDAASGAPVPGAVVIAASGQGPAGRAMTNREGIYNIKGLAPGRYKVSARAEGFYPAAVPDPVAVQAGEMTRQNVELKPMQRVEPGRITGVVTDVRTGEPVPNAVVTAQSEYCTRRARTDERGRYALRDLRPGEYKVWARARAYKREQFPKPVLVEPGQTVENIDFNLVPKPRKGLILGRVTDKRTGQPIPGAVVLARGEHGAGRAVTDRHGFYKMAVPPGRYEVAARARGYEPATFPHPVPVQPSEPTGHIDFELRRVVADAE